METEKLTRSAILSAMLIMLSIIFIGTGIGGQIYLDFIVPVVIVIIYLRCGFKWAMLASINTLLVIALGLGRITAGVWMIQSIMLGLLAGYFIRRKSQVMDDLLLASVAGCVIMLFMDYFLRILTGVSLLDSVDFLGFTGYKELEEIVYYLGIASVPIGTMVIVYVCSLMAAKRLGIIDEQIKAKHKIITNFFKYRPYMYCSRKYVLIGVIYLIAVSVIPMSQIAYVKAFLTSTKYILLYFIVSDCWGIVSQWCYIKTRSPLITNGILIMTLFAMFHAFKWSLYVIVGLGVIMDFDVEIREKQTKALNYLVKGSAVK